MKIYFKNILYFIITLVIAAAVSCGSSSSKEGSGGPVDVNGTWDGTGTSSVYAGQSSDFTTVITESNSILSGKITISYLSLNNADLKGTLNGANLTFGDINNVITFSGKVNGNSASGTYVIPSLSDSGTWSASKIIPPTPPAILFSDDFNRADSATVGNGWNEAEGSGDTGKMNDISISNNRMVLLGGYTSTYCVNPTASRAIAVNTPIKATIVFSVDSSSLYYLENILNDYSLNYYSLIFQSGGNVSIDKNGSFESLTNSYPLTVDHVYTAVITLNNGAITIAISDNGGTPSNFSYTDPSPLTEFDYLNIAGGWHDGTTAYKTYIDSALLETL